MFLSRSKKINVYPYKPQFYCIKVGFKGVKLYRPVLVVITYVGHFEFWSIWITFYILSECYNLIPRLKTILAEAQHFLQYFMCAQLSAWRRFGFVATHRALCEGSDQIARTRRLISVFAGRTYNLVGNVVAPLFWDVHIFWVVHLFISLYAYHINSTRTLFFILRPFKNISFISSRSFIKDGRKPKNPVKKPPDHP